MKMILLLFVTIIMLSATALAAEQFYTSVHYDEDVSAGENVEVYYTVTNVGDRRADDVTFSVYIPDMDVYTPSNSFDIGRGNFESGVLTADIPRDIKPGEYVVKFTARDSDEIHTRYRYVFVE